MATTNIFMNGYEQPENKLTYSFLCLIEKLDRQNAQEVLSKLVTCLSGIDSVIDSVSVRLVYGGHPANPDGSISLHFDDPQGSQETQVIYLENKTWRRSLDIEQIKKHIATYIEPSQKDVLVAITTDANDKAKLDALGNRRVYHITWDRLVEELQRIARECNRTNPKDAFLLSEFVEYTQKTDEVRIAKMIDMDLIKAVSPAKQFYKEAEALMTRLQADLAPKFSKHIRSHRIHDHWGRLGVECQLTDNPWEKFLFFGVYYDTKDHGIPFTEDERPDFAIFLDMDPKQREQKRLDEDGGIKEAAKDLEDKDEGFRCNIPTKTTTWNPWRVCHWQESMCKHVGESLDHIENMFGRKLEVLFNSDLYRLLYSR